MNEYRRPYGRMLAACLLLGSQMLVWMEWAWRGTTKLLAGPDAVVSPSLKATYAHLDEAGMLSWIATATAFLVWLLAVQRNLKALGSETQLLTPGKVIGGWFIPLFNLIHGRRELRQVWIESQPGEILVEGRVVPRRATLVEWWWGVYWGSFLLLVILVEAHPDPFGSARHWAFYYVSSAGNIAAAVLAIVMIAAIDRRQQRQHHDLVAALAPPPPPDRPL